jgi:murein tripeptide amidase MpaA
MDFNRYFNNQELESTLQEWIKAYPQLVSVGPIGLSFEKRPIWLLTITNQNTGSDKEKPALWLDANIHASEIAGTTTALYIVDNLLNGYGKDAQITRLVDTCTFYIVPRINPDGAALALAARPRFIRSGVRAYPWEDRCEGLHVQDIDGDGRILQMRVPDPSGDWKISSLNPRLLEKRRPDENEGTFYRLFPEGLIKDYDGYLVKLAHPLEGLDFNRNFPYEWRPEGEQEGAGPYPTSEPEIKAVTDFISTHPNINIAITYHTFSAVILRPYSIKSDDEMETEDLWIFKKMGNIGTKLTGYRAASTFHEFKYHPKEVTTGAFDDWIYDLFGVYSFTIEVWDLPTMAGIQERKFSEWSRDHPHEQDVQILQWAEENAGEGAYVDWYAFDHPQLGKVELGGWNTMYTWRNPPAKFMGAEAARHLPFVLALCEMVPHLSIHTLEAVPLGEDNYRINLVVENTGFLPAYTSLQGKKRKATRPVRTELELSDGAALRTGKRLTELPDLEGRSNKFELDLIWAASPTDNRAHLEWVVYAPDGGSVTLKIISERAGTLTRSISLGAS